MKLIKSLTMFACAFAFVATVAMAEDSKPNKNPAGLPTCCAKAQKAGKECDHACCVAAKKEGKICDKCPQPAKHKAKKVDAPAAPEAAK
jgi:hypothetical protein